MSEKRRRRKGVDDSEGSDLSETEPDKSNKAVICHLLSVLVVVPAFKNLIKKKSNDVKGTIKRKMKFGLRWFPRPSY